MPPNETGMSEPPRSESENFILRNKLQAGLASRRLLDNAFLNTLDFLQKGKIPLLLAVEAGNQSMCRELLSQNAQEQLRMTNSSGDLPLHVAARKKDIDLVRILVDYGAQIDGQNVSTISHYHIFFISNRDSNRICKIKEC
jgi:ankyrin repeat protein